jgi:hypothetical protein
LPPVSLASPTWIMPIPSNSFVQARNLGAMPHLHSICELLEVLVESLILFLLLSPYLTQLSCIFLMSLSFLCPLQPTLPKTTRVIFWGTESRACSSPVLLPSLWTNSWSWWQGEGYGWVRESQGGITLHKLPGLGPVSEK